jgi:MFS family permease
MTKFSKWTLLMAMDLILILGSGLTLIDHMAVITVGKFLVGITVGGFSVYCPMMLNELVPIELKGPFLSTAQVSIGLGVFAVALLGLAIPEKPTKDSFYVQEYWRWVWGFQIFLALVQMLLLLIVLKSDTPVELKARGD